MTDEGILFEDGESEPDEEPPGPDGCLGSGCLTGAVLVMTGLAAAVEEGVESLDSAGGSETGVPGFPV